MFKDHLDLWVLDYTGVETESLVDRLPSIVNKFEEWYAAGLLMNAALQKESDRPPNEIYLNYSPVDFNNHLDYEHFLQLLSIAILLRDAVSIKRILATMKSHRGRDGLFEQLILDYVHDPMPAFDALDHDEPYGLLFEAFFGDDDDEAPAIASIA